LYAVHVITRYVVAKVPGFGPTDVTYPPYMQGVWDVQQRITNITRSGATNQREGDDDKLSSIPSIRALVFGSGLGADQVITYQRTYTVHEDKVVLDRQASTASLYKALIGVKGAPDVQWDAGNPNVLTVTVSGKVDEVSSCSLLHHHNMTRVNFRHL
jgi:hypothetical protein